MEIARSLAPRRDWPLPPYPSASVATEDSVKVVVDDDMSPLLPAYSSSRSLASPVFF